MPNNSETFCHVCFAHRVDGHQTDALQAAVAARLLEFDTHGAGIGLADFQAQALDLLAVMARTLREHKPSVVDW